MEETKWYLRKSHDGSEFGPIPFDQVRRWAAEAQIAPLDRVSTDGRTWLKAPMVPELAMDYLIEVGDDQYYGPTTVGALQEFLKAGEGGFEVIEGEGAFRVARKLDALPGGEIGENLLPGLGDLGLDLCDFLLEIDGKVVVVAVFG